VLLYRFVRQREPERKLNEKRAKSSQNLKLSDWIPFFLGKQMSLNELVKSEEHVTLKLFRAFLEDFSKCPMHLRGTLMSRIRVELFSVVSSASFNYLPHLFDVLVVQAEWQLLNCLISLLDWLPIGKVSIDFISSRILTVYCL